MEDETVQAYAMRAKGAAKAMFKEEGQAEMVKYLVFEKVKISLSKEHHIFLDIDKCKDLES